MLTLYGARQSRASRVLWVLEELCLPYRHVPLAPNTPDLRSPEYLAINPAGKVPTLVEDEFVLTESVAITYYLASKRPNSLWPSDPRALARIYQWSSWASTDLEFPLTTVVCEMRRAAAANTAPDQALIATCLQAAETTLGTLEAHLANGRQYVAHSAFSIGDINTAISVSFVAPRVDMSRFPATKAWLDRCFVRPGWQRVQAIDEDARRAEAVRAGFNLSPPPAVPTRVG